MPSLIEICKSKERSQYVTLFSSCFLYKKLAYKKPSTRMPKIENLAQLKGKSSETLVVPALTVSEKYSSSTDLKVATTVCFMCLNAKRLMGTAKYNVC